MRDSPAMPTDLAECDARIAEIASAIAATRARRPQLEEQADRFFLEGNEDDRRRVEDELIRLDVEIRRAERAGQTLAAHRASLQREASLRAHLARAAQSASAAVGLSERVIAEYPEAAEKIAALLADLDRHYREALIIADVARADPTLTPDDKKQVVDALGKTVRFLVNGPELKAFFGPWWLPELVYLPRLAPGQGYFWFKPSTHNAMGSQFGPVPLQGG